MGSGLPYAKKPVAYEPRKNSSAIGPVVDGEPIGKGAGGRARRRQRQDAGAEQKRVAEGVFQVAAEHHLGALAHHRVVGPSVEHVLEVRIQQPASELDLDLVELDVVSLVDLHLLAETVDEGVVESLLVEIAHVRIDADAHLAVIVARDAEATSELIGAEIVLIRCRRHDLAELRGRCSGGGFRNRRWFADFRRFHFQLINLAPELIDLGVLRLELLVQLLLILLELAQALEDLGLRARLRQGSARQPSRQTEDTDDRRLECLPHGRQRYLRGRSVESRAPPSVCPSGSDSTARVQGRYYEEWRRSRRNALERCGGER